MNAFFDFLREYWFQLATGLFAIVEVILIVVKRKPKSLDDFKLALEEALAAVPDLVILRERPGEGVCKKKEVIISCLKHVECRLGRSLSDNEVKLVNSSVENQIETVLSTPTKKEKFNEK